MTKAFSQCTYNVPIFHACVFIDCCITSNRVCLYGVCIQQERKARSNDANGVVILHAAQRADSRAGAAAD